jgi:hypothetical protein
MGATKYAGWTFTEGKWKNEKHKVFKRVSPWKTAAVSRHCALCKRQRRTGTPFACLAFLLRNQGKCGLSITLVLNSCICTQYLIY